MSRGGRRRRSKRGRHGPGTADRHPWEAEQDPEEEGAQPPRGRSHAGGGAAGDTSVLTGMTSRSGRLQTLPPDGTVLEELISAMQTEYGVPATPQEYRLIVKTAGPEESTDPSIEVRPVVPAAESVDATSEDAAGASAGNRRRRRSRRRPGNAGGAGITTKGDDRSTTDGDFSGE